MELSQLNNLFSDKNLINFFYRTFVIVFAFLYLLYAFVIKKQTSIMINTVKGHESGLIRLIANLQIFIALGLIFLAIFTA